jgi:hypothetical protein
MDDLVNDIIVVESLEGDERKRNGTPLHLLLRAPPRPDYLSLSVNGTQHQDTRVKIGLFGEGYFEPSTEVIEDVIMSPMLEDRGLTSLQPNITWRWGEPI